MYGEGEGVESLQQCRGRRIEKFVTNTEDASGSRSCRRLPAAITNYFLEWDAISRSAPCRNDDLGIEFDNFFRRHLPPRSSNKFSAGSLSQLGDPLS